VHVESIKVGDYVTSHKNKPVKVTEIGNWRCNINNKSDLTRRIYKIPAGKQNTTSDLYLSFFHRIYTPEDGWLRKPISLGYKEAKDSEVTQRPDGKYSIYHIRVEDGNNNHLIVNGGCFAESWVEIP
jgi:hypothetical protein